jgi:hypothetical protein
LATEYAPDGRIVGESSIVAGVEKGVARDWYGNGQLRSESGLLGSGLHGISRAWYPDGRLKREDRGEFGIPLATREWDPKGNLVRDFQLEPSDWRYPELMFKRRDRPGEIVWKDWPGKSVWDVELPSPYPLPLPEGFAQVLVSAAPPS